MSRSVPEWRGASDDTPVPPRVRDRVRQRDGNICCGCHRPLHNERAECDHVVPLIADGENRESNLQTLCLWCHARKSKADVALKSKSYKRRSRHHGARKAKYPMRGWRRFDGSPVRNPKLMRRSGA